ERVLRLSDALEEERGSDDQEARDTADKQKQWRSIEQALEDAKAPERSKSPWRLTGPSLWLAAGWLTTAAGLGIWIYLLLISPPEGRTELSSKSSRGELGRKVSPGSASDPTGSPLSIAPRTIELLSSEMLQRRNQEASAPSLELADPGSAEPPGAGEGRVVLSLVSNEFRQVRDVRGVLRTEKGEELASIDRVVRQPGGSFWVTLHLTRLEPGSYELELTAEMDGERATLGSYPFRVGAR
ncbi:MAG: hypothetical protein MI919_21040, partial [Holophagales bacterium]|nr:hypothetical protein [Holophagales bacterium]